MITLTTPKVVTIPLSSSEVEMCERYAANSAMGGRSHVRADREQRLQELSKDQLIGHLGNLAGCKWQFGLALGHYIFRVTQHNFRHRWTAGGMGDGGMDILGCNVDFKSCEWSLEGARPLEQVFLPVRPGERHDDWVYMLVLVEPSLTAAHLVGWARDSDLGEVNGEGAFEGAHVVYSSELTPLPPFGWSL